MTSLHNPDTLNLRLILVSGKTEEFTFSPSDSAADIAKHVYENWPMGERRLLRCRTSTWLWGLTARIHYSTHPA
ncbi:UBL3 protein, partial [Polyodon spathula]|nr:UBL3 protein [Polyodon spathula]